jgi:DNA repair exonuclease SbcCD ATPase subunit
VDFQNSAEEMLKWYEAMAFRLPHVMTQAFDKIVDFSAQQMELWWRSFYAPGSHFLSAMWPQGSGAAEFESLAGEIEEIRAQLRSDSAERSLSEAAVAARFDHLRGELAALRDELDAALAKKANGEEIEQLRAELSTLREQLGKALGEREAARAESAAALSDLQTELRALRDKMESRSTSAQPTPSAGAPPASAESVRKRPRR